MKKRKIIICVIVIAACLLTLIPGYLIFRDFSYLLNPSPNEVILVEEESYFMEYVVEDSEVKIYYCIVLDNPTTEDKFVSLIANFKEDQENGLLQEAQIIGFDITNSMTWLYLPANRSVMYHVEFTGAFGGNDQMIDQSLPEIQILEDNLSDNKLPWWRELFGF